MSVIPYTILLFCVFLSYRSFYLAYALFRSPKFVARIGGIGLVLVGILFLYPIVAVVLLALGYDVLQLPTHH